MSSGNKGTPFLKIYAHNKLVKPENGPVSDALGKLVENELLDKEPYTKMNVTKEKFFENPTGRKWFDILILSERFKINGNNPLREIAFEAIKSFPLEYIHLTIRDICMLFFSIHQYYPPASKQQSVDEGFVTSESLSQTISQRIANNNDDDIAISYYELEMYRDKGSLERIVKLKNAINSLGLNLPISSGNQNVAKLLNFMTSIYPGMIWFILAGALAIFLKPQNNMTPLIFMLFLSVGSVIAASIAVNNVPHYRIIFDPVFIIFGVIGCFSFNIKKNNVVDKA